MVRPHRPLDGRGKRARASARQRRRSVTIALRAMPVVSRQASVLAEPDLRRYADAIVGSCVDLRAGETLLIDCEHSHRELAVALAGSAYRAGAVIVDVNYSDRQVQRARIADGPDASLGQVAPWQLARLRASLDPKVAIIRIVGDEAPGKIGRAHV